MVFAAKGISDGIAANGGFHWVVVGNQLSGTLDTSGAHGFGACAESATSEQQCSLNHDPTADAEDPRVAAGTMTAGSPTVPWVVWDESVSGADRIFVSRLVGTGATAHFQIVNHGAPLATFTHGDTRPDITFSANTPYVTWRADFLGGTRGFVGHFVNPNDPIFVFDEFNVPLTPTSLADVREPISSNCTANPFNADGSACQGGPVPTPFFLFTQGRASFACSPARSPPAHSIQQPSCWRTAGRCARAAHQDKRPAKALPGSQATVTWCGACAGAGGDAGQISRLAGRPATTPAWFRLPGTGSVSGSRTASPIAARTRLEQQLMDGRRRVALGSACVFFAAG